ncbi:septal ring lytic transglycosylase RlpA family protein [Methylomonas sp. EFPC3]|uniref:septal ring lytic transglycosylase RlpA family protein n=1 Tax=Methylomonas TaxID=416 RepID=UPI00112D817C|nr:MULTISPECIES: septal ring lytic transglycosylase RlpA family protein [Methylomonas]TPQ29608.1 septal ring lytic transglycosylase RlpA family lipoprotein [Methylomonas koyamae]WFP50737.1 septal ring lytic transglycosylase RlpA family protein [Methylomonas sp. EFPC3]
MRKARWIAFLTLSTGLASVSSVSYAKTEKHGLLSIEQSGIASYYSDKLHGQRTANGEVYDKNAMTAAHASLPFGSVVRVVNLSNNRSVQLRINSRASRSNKRLLDVSKQAARELGFVEAGLAKVKLEVVRFGDA